jgi:hypothetical protein
MHRIVEDSPGTASRNQRYGEREGSQSEVPLISRVKQRRSVHPDLHDVLVDASPVVTLLPRGRCLQGQMNANHRGLTLAPTGETEGHERLNERNVR